MPKSISKGGKEDEKDSVVCYPATSLLVQLTGHKFVVTDDSGGVIWLGRTDPQSPSQDSPGRISTQSFFQMPSHTFRISTLVLLAILGIVWFAAPGDNSVDEDPIRAEELYGIWTLNRSTLDRGFGTAILKIEKAESAEHTIEIRNDGTCTYSTLTFFHPGGTYLRSEGTWLLKKDLKALVGETWYVEFDLNAHRAHFYLKRKNGRIIMYDFFGDPDLQQFVEFERP